MASVRTGTTEDAGGKPAEDVGADAEEVAGGVEESPASDATGATEEDMASAARVGGLKPSDTT
jgi:hypothetical protein